MRAIESIDCVDDKRDPLNEDERLNIQDVGSDQLRVGVSWIELTKLIPNSVSHWTPTQLVESDKSIMLVVGDSRKIVREEWQLCGKKLC